MGTVKILLVCTANVCRSAAAEQLFSAVAPASMVFFSRGVDALVGAPMCPVAADFSRTQGAEVRRDHRARQVQLRDIDEASLVLTASETHVGHLMTMRPGAQSHTFTLLQAARIMQWRRSSGGQAPPAGSSEDRLAWLLDELSTYRGLAPRVTPGASSSRARLLQRTRKEKPLVRGDSLGDAHEGGVHHTEIFGPLLGSVSVIADVLGFPVGPVPGPNE